MSETSNIFDATGKVIIEMGRDLEATQLKYGENTRFVVQKRKQIQAIAGFYDHVAEKINHQERIIQFMIIENRALKLMAYKNELGITYKQVARSMGVNPKMAEIIDKFDTDLNNIIDDKK